MRIASFNSPSFGEVSIATVEGNADVLCCVQFGPSSLVEERIPFLVEDIKASDIVVGKVLLALEQGREYEDPISMIGSDFQKKVWRTIRLIPYGHTIPYAELAEAYGNRKAVRAVAKAVGANPLAVIVPCHRVVGIHNPDAYRWGWDIKRKLLDKEYLAINPMEIVLS